MAKVDAEGNVLEELSNFDLAVEALREMVEQSNDSLLRLDAAKALIRLEKGHHVI